MERLTERELYDGKVVFFRCAKTECPDKCTYCDVPKEARRKFKEYEDVDEAGLIATCHCKDCAHKEWRGNSGRVYCPRTHSWRDADDFCKFAKRGEEKHE